MSYNLDTILMPYADDQPKVSMKPSKKSCTITRMPPIATPEGINPQFQDFFDNVVASLCDISRLDELYDFSDKSVDEKKFMDMVQSTVGHHLNTFYSIDERRRGIDVELNLGRFENKHRNLIGGLYVMTYIVKDGEFEGIQIDTQVEQQYTELLFTYKDGEFVLISSFSAFKNVVED